MSTQSSSNEGKVSTNEKIHPHEKNPQVELNLLSPPPVDPSSSSSSSTVLSSHHDPPHVVSPPTSETVDLVAAKLAQLFSIVGRLSSENQELKAQVEGHSSAIARPSSENEELRKRDEETTKTMKEMSKVLPGNHWVWEAARGEAGGKGRWCWSGAKYKPNPPRIAAGPPTSLLSLPAELVDSILALLPRADVLSICAVSFGLLQRASPIIYRPLFDFGGCLRATSLFLSARVKDVEHSSSRITSLLAPTTVEINHSVFGSAGRQELVASLQGVERRGQIVVPTITIVPKTTSTLTFLRTWSSLLALFNPRQLRILAGDLKKAVVQRPSTFLVNADDDLSFVRHWSRLNSFMGYGLESIPVLSDGVSTLAFSECMGRATEKGTARMFVRSELGNGEMEVEWIAEKDVASELSGSGNGGWNQRSKYLTFCAIVRVLDEEEE